MALIWLWITLFIATAYPLIDGGAKKIYLVFRLLLDKGRGKSSDAGDHSSDESTRQTPSEKDASRVVAADKGL